jgi:hypothetical protein
LNKFSVFYLIQSKGGFAICARKVEQCLELGLRKSVKIGKDIQEKASQNGNLFRRI